MSKQKLSLAQQLIAEINRGSSRAFGIAQPEPENQKIFLVTQNHWLPVDFLRVSLTVKGGHHFQATETTPLPCALALGAQDGGDDYVRLALLSSDGNETLFSSDMHEITGFVTVSAKWQYRGELTPFVMSALLFPDGEILLYDASAELSRYCELATRRIFTDEMAQK